MFHWYIFLISTSGQGRHVYTYTYTCKYIVYVYSKQPAMGTCRHSHREIKSEPLVTATCVPNDDRQVINTECRFEDDEKLPNNTEKLAVLSMANLVSGKRQIHHDIGSKLVMI